MAPALARQKFRLRAHQVALDPAPEPRLSRSVSSMTAALATVLSGEWRQGLRFLAGGRSRCLAGFFLARRPLPSGDGCGASLFACVVAAFDALCGPPRLQFAPLPPATSAGQDRFRQSSGQLGREAAAWRRLLSGRLRTSARASIRACRSRCSSRRSAPSRRPRGCSSADPGVAARRGQRLGQPAGDDLFGGARAPLDGGHDGVATVSVGSFSARSPIALRAPGKSSAASSNSASSIVASALSAWALSSGRKRLIRASGVLFRRKRSEGGGQIRMRGDVPGLAQNARARLRELPFSASRPA